MKATVLIVPGLRGHVPEHWQTLLAERLPNARTVPPLEVDGLNCAARVAAIEAELAQISGPVILVAHSAGVLMVAHWAARHGRRGGADGAAGAGGSYVAGALLVTPPDLNAAWPSNYPQPEVLRAQGWDPLPAGPLPFPSIVCASDNDHLASAEAVRDLARGWGGALLELGEVGHMNPASGYGSWPLAEELVVEMARMAGLT